MNDLKTGDVLRLELGNGIVNSWYIEAFYYGTQAQESVIELTAMGIRPPANNKKNVEIFVPANLIHKALEGGLLTVFRPTIILENAENSKDIQAPIDWQEIK